MIVQQLVAWDIKRRVCEIGRSIRFHGEWTIVCPYVRSQHSSLGQLGKFADQRRGGDMSEAGLLHVQRTSDA